MSDLQNKLDAVRAWAKAEGLNNPVPAEFKRRALEAGLDPYAVEIIAYRLAFLGYPMQSQKESENE